MTERVLVALEADIFGARALAGLAQAGHEVVAAVVRQQEDWAADRYLARRNPAFSVTAGLARLGLQPMLVSGRQDWPKVLRAIDELGVTLLLNVHFPWRVPEAVLQRLPGRALNLHPALLPACRTTQPGPEYARIRANATIAARPAVAGIDTGTTSAASGEVQVATSIQVTTSGVSQAFESSLVNGMADFVVSRAKAEVISYVVSEFGKDLCRPDGNWDVATFFPNTCDLVVGRDDVAVYDGSWTEWGGRRDTPVEV